MRVCVGVRRCVGVCRCVYVTEERGGRLRVFYPMGIMCLIIGNNWKVIDLVRDDRCVQPYINIYNPKEGDQIE